MVRIMLLILFASLLPKCSDQAVIDLGMTIMLPDPFCSRLPPWPLLLVRPEFKVYTRSKNKAFTVTISDEIPRFINELDTEGYFNKTHQVVFITHGFMGSNKCTPWLNSIKDAILKEDDSTIFIMDWRFGADVPEYGTAASNTETTSTAIALVAQAVLVTKTFNGNTNDLYLYCIGHSLGAHTCGQAGRKSRILNNEPLFDRITGLDPAGPGFEMCGGDKHIGKDSAQCVDIIHTDGSLKGHLLLAIHFGTLTSWGHIDFYPNGGHDQPGCTPLGNDCGCSHRKAPELFLATISRANDCEASGFCSYAELLPESCSNETRQLIGYYSSCHFRSTHVVEGIFYIDVKSENPFC